ncbi:MAG: TetR/AcrR family transcriptional regulator [Verrucomicrobiaceae bacterium]|nr:TetR/AcrR family transcriptional regulator [Verrucomicrobiaceae bacterium]
MINSIKKSKKRRNVQGERKRDLLIRIAAKEFAQKGYYHASINEIAELAGVKTSAIIYHFKSKKNFFQTIVYQYFVEKAKFGDAFIPIVDADENNPQAISQAIYDSINNILTLLFDPQKKIKYLSGLLMTVLRDGGPDFNNKFMLYCEASETKAIEKLKRIHPNLSETDIFWEIQSFWGIVLYTMYAKHFVLAHIQQKKITRDFINCMTLRYAKRICQVFNLPIPEGDESWTYVAISTPPPSTQK